MTQYDEVVLSGGRILRVHTPDRCADQVCGIHNPSDHPLRHAPRAWRDDRGLMERVCEHGIGHPDPDGLAFLKRTQGSEATRGMGIHGCDGCCRPESKPIPMEFVKRELPQPPRLLPLAEWLADGLGTWSRQWALCFAAACLLFLFLGFNSGPLFVGMLCGMTYYASTTFFVRHYKHHHSQYFRRSNR